MLKLLKQYLISKGVHLIDVISYTSSHIKIKIDSKYLIETELDVEIDWMDFSETIIQHSDLKAKN
jgi:hypothetical protein